MYHEYIYTAGGDIEKFRDKLLSLCDKLMEGDVDENICHLRYKIEIFTKLAIEQIKESAENKEAVSSLTDSKRRRLSPAPLQPGRVENTNMAKTEPASPSRMTLTEETALSKLSKSTFCNYTLIVDFMSTAVTKRELLAKDLMSIYTAIGTFSYVRTISYCVFNVYISILIELSACTVYEDAT